MVANWEANRLLFPDRPGKGQVDTVQPVCDQHRWYRYDQDYVRSEYGPLPSLGTIALQRIRRGLSAYTRCEERKKSGPSSLVTLLGAQQSGTASPTTYTCRLSKICLDSLARVFPPTSRARPACSRPLTRITAFGDVRCYRRVLPIPVNRRGDGQIVHAATGIGFDALRRTH